MSLEYSAIFPEGKFVQDTQKQQVMNSKIKTIGTTSKQLHGGFAFSVNVRRVNHKPGDGLGQKIFNLLNNIKDMKTIDSIRFDNETKKYKIGKSTDEDITYYLQTYKSILNKIQYFNNIALATLNRKLNVSTTHNEQVRNILNELLPIQDVTEKILKIGVNSNSLSNDGKEEVVKVNAKEIQMVLLCDNDNYNDSYSDNDSDNDNDSYSDCDGNDTYNMSVEKYKNILEKTSYKSNLFGKKQKANEIANEIANERILLGDIIITTKKKKIYRMTNVEHPDVKNILRYILLKKSLVDGIGYVTSDGNSFYYNTTIPALQENYINKFFICDPKLLEFLLKPVTELNKQGDKKINTNPSKRDLKKILYNQVLTFSSIDGGRYEVGNDIMNLNVSSLLKINAMETDLLDPDYCPLAKEHLDFLDLKELDTTFNTLFSLDIADTTQKSSSIPRKVQKVIDKVNVNGTLLNRYKLEGDRKYYVMIKGEYVPYKSISKSKKASVKKHIKK